MKKLLILFSVLTLTSCAYFNIYYNANKYYKEAVSAKKENTRNLSYKSKADSTISKASKLIQYYPKSDLVDDALLLIAKAYVLKGGRDNYMKALTKLDEIEKYYNHKKIDNEINYLYAYIYYQNSDFESALNRLSAIKHSKNSDVLLLKAKCLVALNRNNDAIKLLASATQKKIPSGTKINIYEYMGGLYSLEKHYDKSVLYYRKILNLHPNKEKQYAILLKISNDKIFQGDYENALKSLNKLRDRAPDQDKYNLVSLSIAKIDEKLNKYDEAAKIYNKIITSSRNDSITIRAINNVSLIEENINDNLKDAINVLKSTDKIRLRDSLYYACRSRLKSLNKITELTKIDSIKGDSISPDSLLQNKLRIAELYSFNLNHPEKAKSILFDIYNSRTVSKYNDKILYLISWMYKNIDSDKDSADYYAGLLTKTYPHSFYARIIKNEENKITNNKQ